LKRRNGQLFKTLDKHGIDWSLVGQTPWSHTLFCELQFKGVVIHYAKKNKSQVLLSFSNHVQFSIPSKTRVESFQKAFQKDAADFANHLRDQRNRSDLSLVRQTLRSHTQFSERQFKEGRHSLCKEKHVADRVSFSNQIQFPVTPNNLATFQFRRIQLLCLQFIRGKRIENMEPLD